MALKSFLVYGNGQLILPLADRPTTISYFSILIHFKKSRPWRNRKGIVSNAFYTALPALFFFSPHCGHYDFVSRVPISFDAKRSELVPNPFTVPEILDTAVPTRLHSGFCFFFVKIEYNKETILRTKL